MIQPRGGFALSTFWSSDVTGFIITIFVRIECTESRSDRMALTLSQRTFLNLTPPPVTSEQWRHSRARGTRYLWLYMARGTRSMYRFTPVWFVQGYFRQWTLGLSSAFRDVSAVTSSASCSWHSPASKSPTPARSGPFDCFTRRPYKLLKTMTSSLQCS